MTPTNGNHCRIEWDVGGKTHFVTGTPSDRRARLNDRARIRRQLRDAGVYQKDKRADPAPKKNGGAPLILPSLDERLSVLEWDVVVLQEMIESVRQTVEDLRLLPPVLLLDPAPKAPPKANSSRCQNDRRASCPHDLGCYCSWRWADGTKSGSAAGSPRTPSPSR